MINYLDTSPCKCGKTHSPVECKIVIGNGVISRLPELINKFNAKKPFILSDVNTQKAAGEAVCEVLNNSDIPYSIYVFGDDRLEPDEHAVRSRRSSHHLMPRAHLPISEFPRMISKRHLKRQRI